jgi:ADP-ribose pyrophosphatase YjhB (NUDIX family)
MAEHPPVAPGDVLRHFTVAVFVVHAGRVLLHFHRKLGRWLPPGGHIEANELPDDAALREVLEETGVRARLLGGRGLPIDDPRQLVLPAGIQVERIETGHEHIDLVYFACPADPDDVEIDALLAERDRVGWYAVSGAAAGDELGAAGDELGALGVDAEIQAWTRRALDAVATTC